MVSGFSLFWKHLTIALWSLSGHLFMPNRLFLIDSNPIHSHPIDFQIACKSVAASYKKNVISAFLPSISNVFCFSHLLCIP